ncbi:30S ribosomal protein S14 [Austwickia sp. TVS 96-490-7B]|uniref:30S ribosomal protein S14 n=1 Tax=Austwickia sp. TVS 96-490-7B TaxID=2830843 RepID=UPI001C5898DE|nr:30S ribosomal protein S14 [Austwickia sp. TVS 96-490-7B]MBW3084704.1 30S ribosomal protein S14 [Austwickia sp. TVS 96-490-7B]
MAKKSKIARDAQRREIVARFAEERLALKATIASPTADPDAKAAAQARLQRMPRDASATRLRNRCAVDGRPRAYYRTFGISRVRLREMAHAGELPGVTKSSW